MSVSLLLYHTIDASLLILPFDKLLKYQVYGIDGNMLSGYIYGVNESSYT